MRQGLRISGDVTICDMPRGLEPDTGSRWHLSPAPRALDFFDGRLPGAYAPGRGPQPSISAGVEDFMPAPAPQASRFQCEYERKLTICATWRDDHDLPSRGGCDRAGPDDRFGETLHFFELRTALQQQQINSGGFEFRDASGDLFCRTH